MWPGGGGETKVKERRELVLFGRGEGDWGNDWENLGMVGLYHRQCGVEIK